jgi:hypothetical protein
MKLNNNLIIGAALLGGGAYYAFKKGLFGKRPPIRKSSEEVIKENQAAIDAISAEQEAARIAAANAAKIAAAARKASSLDNPNSYAGKVGFIQSDIGCGLIDGNPGTKAGSETNLKYAAKYGLDKGIISPNNIDYYKSKVVNKLTLVAQKAAAAAAAKKAASAVNVANDAKKFLDLVNNKDYKATLMKDVNSRTLIFDSLKNTYADTNEPKNFSKGTKFYKGNFATQTRGGYVLFKGFGDKRIPLNPSDFIVTP